ncbi:MAG: phosphotransferase [Caldilineaceae bacterium]
MNDQSLQEQTKEERQAVLYQLAQASLPAFGLTGGSLTLLQDLVNSSFRLQHESGRWYLRIYNPARSDRTLVMSELLWLAALADQGMPVPRPLRTLEQALVWEALPAFATEPCLIAIFTWLNGSLLPNDQRMPHHFAAVGGLLAKLHNLSATWPVPASFKRPRCDAAGIYGTLGVLGQQTIQAWGQLPAHLRTDLLQAQAALVRAESAIGSEPTHYGLVHGDPSFGNILFERGAPFLLDFDDCGYGHYIYDLAVVLAGAWDKPYFAENCAALLHGYQQVRELSNAEIAALPATMAARAASLIFWAAAQSQQHPWIEGQAQRLKEYMNLWQANTHG